MHVPAVRRLLGLVVCGLAISSAALAADAVNDPDAALQGEFAGSLLDDAGCCQWVGLQVIALGNGEFQAVEYPGGLPGNGWDKTSKRKLTGARKANELSLESDGRRIVIRGDWAVCHSASCEIGRLQRYRRYSQTLGAAAPPGATVLFNGENTSHFSNGKMTEERLLAVGTDTKQAYRDFSMHLEFRTPWMPAARGQGRGNSGVYIQGRYEVQILDSFGLDGVENECGALYKSVAPRVNMCFPPMTWQTYDIDFMAPRFDDSGKKTANALITVRHNGIYVHRDLEIPNKTGGGAVEGPDARPIKLQNHNNPVHFRNIWIVERDGRAPPHEFAPTRSSCPAPWNVTQAFPNGQAAFAQTASVLQFGR